jgi:hypothetical protein
VTPPAPPGTLPARPAAQVGGGVRSGWPADPTEAAQLEETLSLLSLKRRKVVYRYLETGNARQSVLDAGYRCKDVRSADDVAREILSDPKVQYVLQALLEARGLGLARLDQLLAVHVARFDSPDGGDRDRSLRGIGMFYKYGVPRPPASAATEPDDIINQMSQAELERFVNQKVWPARFRSRLCAAGFAPSSDRTPSGTGSLGAHDPSGGAAPDARPSADVSDACSDDPAGDGEQAISATMPAAPEPSAMRAPSEPTRPPEPLEPQSPHAWQRPEERLYVAPRPPSAQPTPEEQGAEEAARRRCGLLHARLSRDVPPGW